MSYVEFWTACERGDLDTVKKLIGEIREIDRANDRGWSAIIMAAFHHHQEVVQLLLQYGANINSTNANGTTVFMYAKTKVMENGNFDFLNWLIEKGADIHKRDSKRGWTVLEYARELNSPELIQYLIGKGVK
jgi:methionyl-tRNA formyltransferase